MKRNLWVRDRVYSKPLTLSPRRESEEILFRTSTPSSREFRFKTAFFLATFRIAKYFGNAGNWVFWLEFLQNPWVFGKFHWVFREFFKIYDNFCKILNTASIYAQFLGQIMPEIFLLGLSLSFFLEFLNSGVFRLEFWVLSSLLIEGGHEVPFFTSGDNLNPLAGSVSEDCATFLKFKWESCY